MCWSSGQNKCVKLLDKLLDKNCWQFIIGVLVSMLAILVGILGMSGVFVADIPDSAYFGLLNLVFGIWIPHPTVGESESDDKKIKFNARDIKEIQLDDDEIEVLEAIKI